MFLGIDRKRVKAVMLIGFLSVPIYHKVLNSLVTFEQILIFSTSMIWCWVHYDDELIQWYRILIRTLRSREYLDPTAASEFWTDPSETGEQSVEEDCSLYKSSGPRDLQSYSQGLGTEIILNYKRLCLSVREWVSEWHHHPALSLVVRIKYP